MSSCHAVTRVLPLALLCSAVSFHAQAEEPDYCHLFPTNYDFAGWQAPGQTGGGTWMCQPGTINLRFLAAPDAYTVALRRTPEVANLEVRLDLAVFARDGTPEDGLSLLLHWRDPVLPSGCCQPIYGSSGLRVLFSMARGQVEIYEEVGGTSNGPVATLPFALTTGLQQIVVTYRGPLLTLRHGGYLVGTVEVPLIPPGRFGFDLRRINANLVPTLTADCTAPGDYDCDGIADEADNCLGNSNPGQEDLDGDGSGNACDFDDDGDGVADDFDRCPLAADPAQTDSDGDGMGDACDPCPTDRTNDVDGDGICGGVDNCPGIANPDQADLDHDGQGDFCDTNDGVLTLRFTDATHLTWARESTDSLHHIYRGDLDVLRTTGVYVADPSAPGPLDLRSCSQTNPLYVDATAPPPGKVLYYLVSGSRDGVESGLGPDSAGVERRNDHACLAGCDQPFTTVLAAIDGPTTPQYLVIDNLADWCAFRPSACNSGIIDFATDVAVVAALGLGGSSCSGVQFTCMRRAGAGVTAETQEDISGPGCGCLLIATQWMTVARLPRSAGPVTFARASVPLICP